ncbi:MAG: SMP-30/gluconolactonase/LRE family protein [Gemmataceae bacterium]|nr:SMP-30/gluconolactonase/LRE family protein [Gemmataceae bacterium]
MRFALPAVGLLVALVPSHQGADAPRSPEPKAGGYVKKATRAETVRATLAAHGLPTLEGTWHYAGPFDNSNKVGLETAYPPEKGFDPKAAFAGKDGKRFGWEEFQGFSPGRVVGLLPLFPDHREHALVYLYHEFRSPRAFKLPLSFGADDTLTVFFNGKQVLLEDHERAAEPDQFRIEVEVQEGVNRLLLKVGQNLGGWAVYVNPELPALVPEAVRKLVDKDFPLKPVVQAQAPANGDEAAHYRVVTVPLPEDCVLEVGGLAFRPDGKLLACTRRGEIWLVHNPTADPAQVKMTRWASGLHEPLGMWVQDDKTVYVVQRPELTKITDADGDGTADEFTTVCDGWGVSGDYHEFAFGPARDKDGNFFVTLNVGFGGGHQAKAPWRGWCVKVTPDGKMEPWAYGLRSPNGVAFSPDGDLFYADNQGEWVASNKLHHLQKGKFYGHQAPLRWVKDSPFAGLVPEKVASGMRYDGVREGGPSTPAGFPAVDPPAIWFPYGRMGNSVSEPAWDTSGGKFGPFAGQCFIGDQTKSLVMRVALEKVGGVYQGACFPFRSGLQCGVNRLAFAPDGSLFAGQTARGWGSIGGKPYGLQRLVYTGKVPFEVHHVALTRDGFDLTFTKPLDPASVSPGAASVGSFTYMYWSTYGSQEVDRRAETVTAAKPSADGRTLSLTVPGVRPGRVYELRAEGVRAAGGGQLLHDECYYTVNRLRE